VGHVTHFAIDLDLDATPIAGYIADDGDVGHPFHGWLELCSAIEERRAAAPETVGSRGRSAARWASTRSGDVPRTSGVLAQRPAGDSDVCAGDQYRDGRHRAVVPWLAQRTQPMWMLLGAWTCAGLSAVAVPALAITRRTWVLAWWGLGLLAMVVLLTFIWTEQRSSVDPDDHDQPTAAGPPTPSQDGESARIGRHRVEEGTPLPATRTACGATGSPAVKRVRRTCRASRSLRETLRTVSRHTMKPWWR
jgi:hypothetical protein